MIHTYPALTVCDYFGGFTYTVKPDGEFVDVQRNDYKGMTFTPAEARAFAAMLSMAADEADTHNVAEFTATRDVVVDESVSESETRCFTDRQEAWDFVNETTSRDGYAMRLTRGVVTP